MSTEKKVSNPGPLGLLGFGCTTILLNLHNVGLTELSVVILAMGVAVGGLAQLVAGIFEFAHGNTFTGTAFVSYSMFWWSLVIIWINPFSAAGIAGADGLSMGFYLLLWGLYTLAMFIGTLKHNRATQAIFGTLVILFFLLAIENFTGSHTVRQNLPGQQLQIVPGASSEGLAVPEGRRAVPGGHVVVPVQITDGHQRERRAASSLCSFEYFLSFIGEGVKINDWTF